MGKAAKEIGVEETATARARGVAVAEQVAQHTGSAARSDEDTSLKRCAIRVFNTIRCINTDDHALRNRLCVTFVGF